MSVDQGASLQFDPGSALNFDNQLSDHEDEEDTKDVKQREKELEDLLTKTTAFDDLIDDDYETSIDASDVDESRLFHQRASNDPNAQWPLEKKTESSTPRHEVPYWNMDYTPIDPPTNPALFPYHLPNRSDSCDISFNISSKMTSEQKSNNAALSKVANTGYRNSFLADEQYSHSNGHLEDGMNHLANYQQSLDILKGKLSHSNNVNGHDGTVVPEVPSPSYQQYVTEDIIELKERLIQQREESLQSLRSLKHELTLLKGEKESLAFSLTQARDLLVSKNEEIQALQLRAHQVDSDLSQANKKNLVLAEQLQVCESQASALQTQVSELSTFKGYSTRVDAQENLIKNMQQGHNRQVEALNAQLDDKIKELELLQERLQHLEKYQEQTLPNQMRGIDKLTLNLETVQNYCQKILSSEAFHDVDVMMTHQLEDEKLKNRQKEDIETLMKTINNLNQNLQITSNQETVPMSSHRFALRQIEEEKSTLDQKLQAQTREFEEVKKAQLFLAEENRKLQGAMKTMIMKHDLDIKSAIEKYHSIQREETKLLQAELRETAEREKDQMREFYENKISVLCEEAGRVQNLLHETKDLYVRVCEEKNIMEKELKNIDNSKRIDTSGDHTDFTRITKTSLEEKYQEILQREIENVRRSWEVEKAKEFETVLSKYKESVQKETKIKEIHDSENSKKIKELEFQLQEKESQVKSLAEAEQKQVQALHEHYSKLWMERQKEMHEMYKSKLDQIDVVQRRELNNAMEEMHKAMEEDRKEQMTKSREIIVKLKKEYDTQQDKLKSLEDFKKSIKEKFQFDQIKDQEMVQKINQLEQENRTKSELIQQKEQAFLEKFNLMNQEVKILQKDKELLVRSVADSEKTARRNISLQKKQSMGSQTDSTVVPKEEVMELQQLCVELFSQMKEEMEEALAGSSKRAGEHLKSAILEYQHEMLACQKAST